MVEESPIDPGFPPALARAERRAKGVVVLLLSLLALSYPYGIPELARWRVPLAYAFPLGLAGVAGFTLLLLREGTGTVRTLPLLIGSAYLVGGVLADVGATLHHTPDLSREANPVIVALRDAGYGTRFLLLYGGAVQILHLFFLCVLWAAFLRHLDPWLDFAMSFKPRSFGHFLRMALSGREVSWVGFLLPFVRARRKRFYCIFWVIVPILLGIALVRWYLAGVWFGWFPRSWDSHCMAGGVAGGAVMFVALLLRKYRARVAGAGGR